MGFSREEIYDLNVSFGARCIEKEHDLMMRDKIDFFMVHGVDCSDTRIMGTDFYKRYIDRKQKEYYDSIENKFNSKKNKPLKIHPEIDKIIMGKRLEKIK